MSSRNSNNNSGKGRRFGSDSHGPANQFSRGIESAFGMALPRARPVVGEVPSSAPSFRSVRMAMPSPVALSGSLNLRSTTTAASGYDDVPTVQKQQQKDKKSGFALATASYGPNSFLKSSGSANTNSNKNNNDSTPQIPFFDTTQGVTASASKSSSSPIQYQPLQWEIKVLPAIPFYHLLDRTALTISISLAILATRVVDFTRVNSISCSCIVTDGRIDCVTPDFLSFVVKLWRADDGCDDDLDVESLGDDDTVHVTIEVQRRQGSSVEMQSVRNSLYHAIEHGGDGSSARRPSHRAMEIDERLVSKICAGPPPPLPRPMSRAVPAVPAMPSTAVPDSLDVCAELLSSSREDQIRLGLESLRTLTDNTKVSTETATRVSQTLLVGDESGSTVLREAIENHLSKSGDDGDGLGSYYSDTANHLLALGVLANALERMHSLWHELDFSCDFWRVASGVLKANLERAASKPLEAALSAKSLRLLQGMEPSVCGNLLLDDVRNAHSYGKARHQALEIESQQLMDRLITSF